MSKIENKFAQILISSNIRFEQEKTFPNLKNGFLRYDFYLSDLNILIEVDSMLHFKMVPKFHKTEHDFKHGQQNDRLKNSYALAHNIKLYRIPEWEFESTNTILDILKPEHLVKSKWHNDIIYREHLKVGGGQ